MKFRARAIVSVLAAGLAVLAAGGFVARERLTLSYLAWRAPKAPLAARAALLEASMQFLPPAGLRPPYPAVIQLHGCGGMRQAFMEQWATVANQRGYLAVIVDSYAPRGISRERALKTVCAGKELIGTERAGDALAAFEIVRQRSDVDADRIVLAGWSHGAWSVMDLMAMNGAGTAPGGVSGPVPRIAPAGVIAVYPYCGRGAWSRFAKWRPAPPALALVAGADSVVDAQECRRLFTRMKADGGDVDLVVYEDADHVFDDKHLPAEFRHFFHAEAQADAERRYGAFLDRIAAR